MCVGYKAAKVNPHSQLELSFSPVLISSSLLGNPAQTTWVLWWSGVSKACLLLFMKFNWVALWIFIYYLGQRRVSPCGVSLVMMLLVARQKFGFWKDLCLTFLAFLGGLEYSVVSWNCPVLFLLPATTSVSCFWKQENFLFSIKKQTELVPCSYIILEAGLGGGRTVKCCVTELCLTVLMSLVYS